MKIYVTGSTGFIGKRVMKLLERNDNIIEILHHRLHEVDLYAPQLIEFNPDVVLHLAWEGIPDYGYEQSVKNLKYGLDLFDVIRNTDCKRVIVTGSCFEDENNYAMGVAKRNLYEMGKFLFDNMGVDFIWAKLHYVYGEGQRIKSFMPLLILDKIRKIHNPTKLVDYIHVDDVAKALVEFINKGKTDIYEIKTGRKVTLQYIKNRIKQYKKASKKISIEEGIQRMIRYYED